jgi:hypothetical protein
MHPCKVHRRLPIPLLLDGLYANGPVMQRCRGYHWQFMIVLGDQALSTVWQEVRRPAFLKPQTLQRHWGRRQQHFTWGNDSTMSSVRTGVSISS